MVLKFYGLPPNHLDKVDGLFTLWTPVSCSLSWHYIVDFQFADFNFEVLPLTVKLYN